MKKQSGFTLVELVIVVVILGLLAVTAIPKFLDLTDQAKQASLEGLAGGFATGVSLARSQWESEARPKDGSDYNFVNYDGTVVYLTSPVAKSATLSPGYPMGLTGVAALTSGNMTAANCVNVWNSVFSQPPKITGSASDLVDAVNGVDELYYAAVLSVKGLNTNDIGTYFSIQTLDKVANGFATPTDTTKGNNFTYDPANSRVVITINN